MKGTPQHPPTYETAPVHVGYPLCDTSTKGIKCRCAIDILQSQQMQTHQRIAAQFVFTKLIGLEDGVPSKKLKQCILADETGLGKKLTVISVIWSLLRQNPFKKNEGLFNKIVILCPETRLHHWLLELNEWIGEKKQPILNMKLGDSKEDSDLTLKRFEDKNNKILVISFQAMALHGHRLKKPIDLLVADEGHKLGDLLALSHITEVLNSLEIPRRLVLTSKDLLESISSKQPDWQALEAVFTFLQLEQSLSTEEFCQQWRDPIDTGLGELATSEDQLKRQEKVNAARATLEKLCLRRGVEEILESAGVAGVRDVVCYLGMQTEQAKVFNERTQLVRAALSKKYEDSFAEITVDDFTEGIGAVLEVLANPSGLDDLPEVEEREIVREQTSHPENEPEELDDEVANAQGEESIEMRPEFIKIDTWAQKSAKLEELSRVVEFIAPDQQFVVVAHSLWSIEVLKAYFDRKDLLYCVVDRNMTASKCKKISEQFGKSGPSVCKLMIIDGQSYAPKITLGNSEVVIVFDTGLTNSMEGILRGRIFWGRLPHQAITVHRLVTIQTFEQFYISRPVGDGELRSCYVPEGFSVDLSAGGDSESRFLHYTLKPETVLLSAQMVINQLKEYQSPQVSEKAASELDTPDEEYYRKLVWFSDAQKMGWDGPEILMQEEDQEVSIVEDGCNASAENATVSTIIDEPKDELRHENCMLQSETRELANEISPYHDEEYSKHSQSTADGGLGSPEPKSINTEQENKESVAPIDMQTIDVEDKLGNHDSVKLINLAWQTKPRSELASTSLRALLRSCQSPTPNFSRASSKSFSKFPPSVEFRCFPDVPMKQETSWKSKLNNFAQPSAAHKIPKLPDTPENSTASVVVPKIPSTVQIGKSLFSKNQILSTKPLATPIAIGKIGLTKPLAAVQVPQPQTSQKLSNPESSVNLTPQILQNSSAAQIQGPLLEVTSIKNSIPSSTLQQPQTTHIASAPPPPTLPIASNSTIGLPQSQQSPTQLSTSSATPSISLSTKSLFSRKPLPSKTPLSTREPSLQASESTQNIATKKEPALNTNS